MGKMGERRLKMNKVLIVEDGEFLREIYHKKLEQANFEVETAVDGVDGLEKAREFKPDLILLDVIMPGLNGVEFLREIKVHSELNEIPVAILTNSMSGTIMDECLKEGALGYFVKSDNIPRQIVEKVKKFIR
jgi:CheY-like chemotaxis protein